MNDCTRTQEKLTAQLDALFHPGSVALIGVPRGMKMGRLFLTALLEQGFPGTVYPVNPEAAEIDGIAAYPNLSAIPGPVDLAIILVPHTEALSVLRDCAAKGVKGAVLFTAGYRETGTEEGRKQEAELLRIARSSGMRLIGPNGMGLYSPKTGLSFFPGLKKDPGPIGIISHSGSLTNILARTVATRHGLRFSKVASLGNECDLDSADLLTYLGGDEETGLIGCYLEGIKDGPRFLEALRSASLRKPVILWKVGLTAEGARAAASHTGSLAGERELFRAVVRQGGGIPVTGFEAWVDALMCLSMLEGVSGPRMAILSGPGGLAVSAAEACGAEGLRLACLGEETRMRLSRIVPPTGTSLANPVDVGLSASMEMDIYVQAARIAASDTGVDALVVVGTGLNEETNRIYTESMIDVQKACGKPFLMVNIPGFPSHFAVRFCEAGIPFFDSAERAMRAYRLAWDYRRWQGRTL